MLGDKHTHHVDRQSAVLCSKITCPLQALTFVDHLSCPLNISLALEAAPYQGLQLWVFSQGKQCRGCDYSALQVIQGRLAELLAGAREVQHVVHKLHQQRQQVLRVEAEVMGRFTF